MSTKVGFSILAAVLLSSLGASVGHAQQSDIGFFITSAGPGKGADLGGIAGADQLCQLLGATAGAGTKTWHAYLSTQGPGAVNARDRIGRAAGSESHHQTDRPARVSLRRGDTRECERGRRHGDSLHRAPASIVTTILPRCRFDSMRSRAAGSSAKG